MNFLFSRRSLRSMPERFFVCRIAFITSAILIDLSFQSG
jgi:hypothetical protein